MGDLLEALRETWELCPDLRLGQLLEAATTMARPEAPTCCVFYVSDQDLLRGLAIMRRNCYKTTIGTEAAPLNEAHLKAARNELDALHDAEWDSD